MLLLILSGQSTSDFTLVTMALVGFFFIISICVTFYSRDVWSCAGLLSLSYFFIMTDVWEHHYTFILPFLVLAWIRGRPEDKARWVPFVLALLMSLPFMPLIEIASGLGAGAPPSTWSLGWRVLYHSSKVVPALIFYIWLLMTALRSPKADSLLEFYQNAWRDLVSGENPPIQAGIMVSEEIGIEERNSISQNGISV